MSDGPEEAVQKMLADWLLNASPEIIDPDLISFPNARFEQPTPTASARWARVSYLPAETIGFGISDDADNQHYGLMQVDFFAPLEVGELEPTRYAEKVIKLFRKNTVIFGDGYKTRIYATPYRLPMIKDDEWVMVAARVPYKLFAPTPA
jgi:hypothetical protein